MASDGNSPRDGPSVVAVAAGLRRADVAAFVAGATGRLAPGARLRCDARGATADLVAVDALARLALTARRRGATLEIVAVSPELRDLLRFAGLGDLLRG